MYASWMLAEVDPHVRVLVAEQRREVQVLLARSVPQLRVVGARPFAHASGPTGWVGEPSASR